MASGKDRHPHDASLEAAFGRLGRMLPVGLPLIAQDVSFLRRPVGRVLLRLLDGVDRLNK